MLKSDYQWLQDNSSKFQLGIKMLEGDIRTMAANKVAFIYNEKHTNGTQDKKIYGSDVEIHSVASFGKHFDTVIKFPVTVLFTVIGPDLFTGAVVLEEFEVIEGNPEKLQEEVWPNHSLAF